MTGNYFVTTDEITVVYGKSGPLLRFSLTAGFVETDGTKRQLITKFIGCIGRTALDRDPETNEVIPETSHFIWSPPATRMGPRLVQVITVTPDLYDAAIESLHKQGAIDAYKQKVSQFKLLNVSYASNKETLTGIAEVGTYVLA